MRRITPIAVLATTACLAACGGTDPLPTGPSPDGATALVTGGPMFPGGSHLIRLGEQYVISTSDPVREVFTIYANPETMSGCGGSEDPEFSNQYNILETLSGIVRNNLSQARDIPVYVYDFFTPADLAGRTFCEYFAQEWAYRGTANFTEQFHRNLIQNNTSWKWNATGEVLDRDGNPYSFHESQLAVRPAGQPATWLKEDIIVTPRGN